MARHSPLLGGGRAAAGVESDRLPVDGRHNARGRRSRESAPLHPDRPRLAEVLAVCSVLVGDRPVGAATPRTYRRPGDTVELLPPFAGG